jgi:hypothetical protein
MKDDGSLAKSEIPKEASISNPSQPIRLRGSHSGALDLVARRRLEDDGEDPEPRPPQPPPPAVSTPDLALQFPICLEDDMEDQLVSAVRSALGASADVRTACVQNSQRVGVWLRPVVNQADAEARYRGLERINIIRPGETLAFFINTALIRRRANDSFNATPKRLNGDGHPDPDGPIHLTGFSVSFESPDKVVTRVEGFDERPWPDVDFTLKFTDTLSVSGGEPQCKSDRDLDVDTSWLNFLTGLFLIVLPPLGAVFLVQRIIIATRDEPDVNAGAGCSVPALIPQEVLIPAGRKIVASYNRLEVFSGAIVAGGVFDVVARTPSVTILGSTQISVSEGTFSVTKTYSLRTEDLRPPFEQVLAPFIAAKLPPDIARPVPSIRWSGDGVALSPSAETTAFRFDLSGAEAGQIVTRRVAVRVVDVDGLSASAERIVRIHVVPATEEDDFPPICRIKPWLPQCEAPMARLTSGARLRVRRGP